MSTPSDPTPWQSGATDAVEGRLHADAHRAVGGTLNLIREFSRVSQELDPTTTQDRIVKRLVFLSYDLQMHVAEGASEHERLSVLNRFFFDTHRFKCSAEPTRLTETCESFRLNRVLADRLGAGSVLSLIYAYLAERIGVRLEFVDLKPASFLKWTEKTSSKPRPRYIDMTRSGAILTDDELIETLHTRFKMLSICHANVLEPYAFENYLCDYLHDLKKSLVASGDPEHLLFIQDTLISYQPSNLQLLAERALLHRRIGNFKSALSDLKRYFAFHERSKSPVEFVSLYEELTQLLERHKTSIDVLD